MRRLTFLLVLAITLLPGALSAAEAPKPLVTASSNWAGVGIDLMTVERKGSVLTVKWAATNSGEKYADIAFGFTGKDVCYAVDEESGTKYYVLTDKEGNALASASADFIGNSTYGISVRIDPGQTHRFWMKLPAPPPEVKKIGIFLNNVEPFEEIAITDR
ncbi:MAG: hypothetical protein V1750_05315 [Acidobacteriota bacterium]